ncbi:ribosomal protein S21 [Desulfonatronum thiosulfatophilum]|uniref:Small ribosomal subunit protein bS21 n=1 Tax=Desulfonatronum thiosulfatophilum TaxID=617002 RepID=A0A1G6BAH3_9BACT|nr:ribosomal protein S21 [Desulfonatronum thiosulfatophilum]
MAQQLLRHAHDTVNILFRMSLACCKHFGYSHNLLKVPLTSAPGVRPGGEYNLPGIVLSENDHFDFALRKFKKQVEKAGILSELKKRQHYEKPSVQKKKKEAAARKRAIKKSRKTTSFR